MSPLLRRPRWIAGHLLAAAAVAGFVALGFWQLDRLEQRLEYNALVRARGEAAPVPVESLLDRPAGDVAYRRVRAVGTYEPAGEVLLSTRSHAGRAGHHVLTPLRTRDGTLVVVDRGWVPLSSDDPPLTGAAPPPVPVEVTGLAYPPAAARRAGRFDGGDGRLQFVSSVDLDRIAAALGEPVAPVYLWAQEQQPPPAGYPALVEPPPLEEGNHRSYAGQWFLFAAVVAVGYPLLLRRAVREHRAGPAADDRPRAAVPT